MDLIRDLAYPLPVIVIAEMLGMPAADREEFKRWSDALDGAARSAAGGDGMRPAETAFVELSSYFRRVFAAAAAPAAGRPDQCAGRGRGGGETLGEAELLSLTELILGAGHETTTNLIGNGVLALLRNPGERRRLQDDPALIDTPVEELLRYDSPVQLTDRVATVETRDRRASRVRSGVLVALLPGRRQPRPGALRRSRPPRPQPRRQPTTSPSVTARTSVSARRWRAPRPESPCGAAAPLSRPARRDVQPQRMAALHGTARPDVAAGFVVGERARSPVTPLPYTDTPSPVAARAARRGRRCRRRRTGRRHSRPPPWCRRGTPGRANAA